MGVGGEGGCNGGGGKELIETVLTCEGDISDPELPIKITHLIHHLQVITDSESADWLVRKVEPWNSVRVTFSIPKEAAGRLHQLAQAGDAALRQLGILSVQVEEDQVVSLKVAGLNNETTEILIRTEGVAGPSGETGAAGLHSGVSRSVTQALGGVGLLPGFNQQHHPPHPAPQFRSPSLGIADGLPVVGRTPVVQQRPQGYAYAGVGASPIHGGHAQPPHQSPSSVLVSGGGLPHPPPVVARPVFPNTPPPPYPNQELRQAPTHSTQQVVSGTQISGQQQQFAVSQANVITPPPQAVIQQHPPQQISSIVQSVSGGYRVPGGSQVSVASSVASTASRGLVRTQVNMVKNSPLLVGLLQQPEQSSSSSVRPRNNKNVAVNPSQTPPLPLSNCGANSFENGPLSSGVPSPSNGGTPLASAGTYIGRSRDGLTTHQQIFSGGSVITNSAPPPPPPPPRHVANNHHSVSSQPSPVSSTSLRLQTPDDHRRGLAAPSPLNIAVSKAGHHQPHHHQPQVGATAPKDDQKETKAVHFTPSMGKKESQYLINPNTGLLEPRPNTDSSDSEPEGRTESPSHDDQRSNSLASDDESNLSAASRKETDHSDSDVSRVSVASIESKKLINCDRKSQERDSSPGASWDNTPGEKIKLRLKLGTQATIVGNANKKLERRDSTSSSVGLATPNVMEPRVPKLHIKLHPSQPVIIKSVEETEASSRKTSKDLSTGREDKSKRKSGRNKLRNYDKDADALKSENLKIRSKPDDVTSQVFKSKRNKHDTEFEDSFFKYKETPDGRGVKVPRMLEVTKPSKVESKLRTRLKKIPPRKMGDLNSVGEIASHKIMETLPPSITKVAAMHTSHPHRNPNSSSPLPFSSISSSVFTSSSISPSPACPTSALGSSPDTLKAGDTLKAELEKRGSEIISKTEDKSSGDILMSKLRMNNPALKSLMNGDVSHSEKVTINQMRFKRAGSLTSQADLSSASKLTIKRKNSDEAHALKALKKEGLGPMPTFLNSSVLINKVSPDKSSVASLSSSSSHRQSEDLSEKLMKKVESIKRNEIAGLKSNSDITIHSVSKNDILGLTKGSTADFDRRADISIKTKPEITTKVGRVTCVDVMDRKALEEALKSSRNSSKKNDVSFCKSTSSMVDRLRRWNSIDSSSSVPLSSNPLLHTSDSTNVNTSSSVKTECKDPGDCESVILSTVIEKVKTENSISQQSNTVVNVNSDNDCDNSNKDFVDKANHNKDVKMETVVRGNPDDKPETRDIITEVKAKVEELCGESSSKCGTSSQCDTKTLNAYHMEAQHCPKSTAAAARELGKIPDMVSSSLVKAEVDSPEGTPKGEHGNGQGGEDSGIESMDALSEKSPNHSDQSPNRREDKECEMVKSCKTEDKCIEKKHLPTSDVLKCHNNDGFKAENHPDGGVFENKDDDRISKADNKDKPSPMESNSESVKTALEEKTGAEYGSDLTESIDGVEPTSSGADQPENRLTVSESIENESGELWDSNTGIEHSLPADELCKISASSQLLPVTSSCVLSAPLSACPSERDNSDTPIPEPRTASVELLPSSQENLSDITADTQLKESDVERPLPVDAHPPSPAPCSASISITTTSLTVASPKSCVVTSPSVHVYPSISIPQLPNCGGGSSDQNTIKDDSSQGSVLLSNAKDSVLPVNSGFKPSLLAITLSRPPGASIMTSQFAASIANSIDKTSTPVLSKPCSGLLSSGVTTTAVTKVCSSIESTVSSTTGSTTSMVYCNSVPSNNNSLAYCSSYTSSNTNTTATMIILAASTNSSSTTITNTTNNTKVVTLKPAVNQANNSAINPPVGKTFRLVALPGINSMTPAASPVKGQLVTLKPVVAAASSKGSQLLQTIPVSKTEEQSNTSALKTRVSPVVEVGEAHGTGAPPGIPPGASTGVEPVTSEGRSEDLDFVGFSSNAEGKRQEPEEGKTRAPSGYDKQSLKASNLLSPVEEEPTPMRLHPPLYTYGNRERKKEVESDVEEREREEGKEPQMVNNNNNNAPTTTPLKPSEVESDVEVKDEEIIMRSKVKDKKLHALTIEIPSVENIPDDKRLTRSTRQSARLASPKVNSPASGGGELSPRPDKRSPANTQQMMKPSPVGVLRSSVSPALRGTKRRRHESESSCASSVSEDLCEPLSKVVRRKAVTEVKEEARKGGRRDLDHDKEREGGESSDDEMLIEEDSAKKRNSSTASSSNNEDEDDVRPSSRLGRLVKTVTRSMDRTTANAETIQQRSKDATPRSRDTTPTRRTPRQNRVGAGGPGAGGREKSPDSIKESKEKLSAGTPVDAQKVGSEETSPNKDAGKKMVVSLGAKESPKGGVKPVKKDGDADLESQTERRKTRSTTNTATVNEDTNKRRRLSKDK